MKKTIWKFEYNEDGIEMPLDASIIKVGLQRGKIVFWVLCNPKNKIVKRFFIVAYTGDTLETENLVYLNTFQGGIYELVYHVFEEIPKHRLEI